MDREYITDFLSKHKKEIYNNDITKIYEKYLAEVRDSFDALPEVCKELTEFFLSCDINVKEYLNPDIYVIACDYGDGREYLSEYIDSQFPKYTIDSVDDYLSQEDEVEELVVLDIFDYWFSAKHPAQAVWLDKKTANDYQKYLDKLGGYIGAPTYTLEVIKLVDLFDKFTDPTPDW